jgi:hypothetical protein
MRIRLRAVKAIEGHGMGLRNSAIFFRSSSSTPAAHRNVGGRGLAGDPFEKMGDFRVCGQRLDRSVIAGEFGFREYCVDLLVAGAAEENDGVTFGPAKLSASAGPFV